MGLWIKGRRQCYDAVQLKLDVIGIQNYYGCSAEGFKKDYSSRRKVQSPKELFELNKCTNKIIQFVDLLWLRVHRMQS